MQELIVDNRIADLIGMDGFSIKQNSRVTSKSSAKRTLAIPENLHISILGSSPDGLFVLFEDFEIFVPYSSLLEEFQNFRRRGATDCTVLGSRTLGSSNIFYVRGKIYEDKSPEVYQIEASPLGLACTCDDFSSHNHLCKHGWAVLNYMGFETLTDFQKCQKPRLHKSLSFA